MLTNFTVLHIIGGVSHFSSNHRHGIFHGNTIYSEHTSTIIAKEVWKYGRWVSSVPKILTN